MKNNWSAHSRTSDDDDNNMKSIMSKTVPMILTARILVGFVFAFRFAITKQLFVDTLGVTAGQLSFGANWFVGLQQRQHFPRFYRSEVCDNTSEDGGERKGKKKSEISNKKGEKHYKITIHHATVSVMMWKKSVCVIFLLFKDRYLCSYRIYVLFRKSVMLVVGFV